MKTLEKHFEYNNGIYSIVELENYRIEEENKMTNWSKLDLKKMRKRKYNIWLVIYQAGNY